MRQETYEWAEGMAQCFEFDTYNTIYADASPEVLDGALALCRGFNRLLSKTVEGSDVWRINHACGGTVEVSAHTAAILKCAQAIYAASDGAFNVALGPVIDLWGEAGRLGRVPDAEKLERALVGCMPLSIEAEMAGRSSDLLPNDLSPRGAAVRVPEGMSVDLGGIAKGYIADRVADYLRMNGTTCALLNFGGNVVTVGSKPDGSPWNMGLQSPNGEWGRDYWATVAADADSTIVTSGSYERFFELDGRRYHHIVDPRTGYPSESDVLTATVLGHDSMLCDALATSVFVLGTRAGYDLVNRFGARAVILANDGRAVVSPSLALCANVQP